MSVRLVLPNPSSKPSIYNVISREIGMPEGVIFLSWSGMRTTLDVRSCKIRTFHFKIKGYG